MRQHYICLPLFPGNIEPQGEEILYWKSRDKLKAGIVPMAHHGHVCCEMEFYVAVAPKRCIWYTDDWLYNEMDGTQKVIL